MLDKDCIKHNKHESVAKQGVSAHCRGTGVQSTTHKRDELYRVPEKLRKGILEAERDDEEDEVLGSVQDTPMQRADSK